MHNEHLLRFLLGLAGALTGSLPAFCGAFLVLRELRGILYATSELKAQAESIEQEQVSQFDRACADINQMHKQVICGFQGGAEGASSLQRETRDLLLSSLAAHETQLSATLAVLDAVLKSELITVLKSEDVHPAVKRALKERKA
jgi:hypothetical protein